MLKKLQHKFVVIATIALVTIVFVELLAVNMINIYQHDTDSRNMLYLIAENDGILPSKAASEDFGSMFWNPFGRVQITVETPYSTRYFSVKFRGNVVTDISNQNTSSVTDREAVEYASKVFKLRPGFGFVDTYRYYYAIDPGTDSGIIVFLDFEKDLKSTFTLASLSFFVGVILIIVLLLPVYLLSKRALRPVKRSIEAQKQFITDAGHELKTPLTIISADAEVLELSGGENEWLTSIKSQAERMNTLVKNLVDLSKFDEESTEREVADFNISEAVLDTALNFEPMAKSRDFEFVLDVKPNIHIKGSEAEIRQLVSILCDNAIKYTSPSGSIKISLYKSGKTICLDAYNTCENIEKEKLPKLFDRFYRADSSRSRETGGYGIGLSIAKAIVERHRGRITANSYDSKSIVFKIYL